MKNIHILPTDKPSKLYFHKLNNRLGFSTPEPMGYEGSGSWAEGRNIYITSDEEIKAGDWCLENSTKLLKWEMTYLFPSQMNDICKKIILTTDQDLIKDGVQAIDDEFLEWFVNNPSCDKVEVTYGVLKPFQSENKGCLIHCPDNEVLEEPKQETLEEVAERYYEDEVSINAFINGVKWQQEQIGNSEFLQKLRAIISDAEARRLIFEQFKKQIRYDNSSRMVNE